MVTPQDIWEGRPESICERRHRCFETVVSGGDTPHTNAIDARRQTPRENR